MRYNLLAIDRTHIPPGFRVRHKEDRKDRKDRIPGTGMEGPHAGLAMYHYPVTESPGKAFAKLKKAVLKGIEQRLEELEHSYELIHALKLPAHLKPKRKKTNAIKNTAKR